MTSAIGTSKKILQADDRNLIMWDAHARLERLRGKPSVARNMYIAALTSAMSATPEATQDEIDLWQAWLELEIDQDGAVENVLSLFALRDPDAMGMCPIYDER